MQYRLAQGPPLPAENAFPAALLDALAGYNYLVHAVGFAPADILVLGESCGGGLAVGRVQPGGVACDEAFEELHALLAHDGHPFVPCGERPAWLGMGERHARDPE